MISDTTELTDVFKETASHTLAIEQNGKLAGMIHMRDILAVYLEHGSLDGKSASEYMNDKPITISKTDNLLKPARLFVEHRIKSVLMVDGESGEVSNLGPQQLIEDLPSGLLGFYQPVSRVMVSNLITIEADFTLIEAITMLVDRRLSCLPVCDAEGGVIGILSESDMLREVMKGTVNSTLVSEMMTKTPVCIEEGANLQKTWQMMCEYGVMKIFVTTADGRLNGLVTATDVLVALCESLLSTFAIYHCPEGTDLMVEWRNNGMIMAVSDALADKVGCEAENLVGLHWQNGCSEEVQDLLLKLPKTETINIDCKLGEQELNFDVRRDIEQAAMWFRLV